MKKIITILLALSLMFSVMPMALSTSAEGNVITVSDCTTFKNAVSSATNGDTIQLADNIELSPSETNQDYSIITLSKNITLDTNGYILYCGGIATAKPKISLFKVNKGYELTVINSKRTAQITTSDSFDIICNAGVQSGVFIVDAGGKLVCRNITVKDVNRYANNTPSVICIAASTTSNTPCNVILDNCYLNSNNFSAIRLNNDCITNFVANNCILGGGQGSICSIIQNTASTPSNLAFNNCTFLSAIGVASATNSNSAVNGTNSVRSLNYTFTDCIGTKIYGYDLNAKFIGANKFETVCEKVVLSADESTGLYSDDTYETELTAGVLTTDTPVYTKLLSSETSPVTMQKGASIRLNDVNGIRFYTTVDTAKLEELKKVEGNVVELGTLIAPADLVTDELTHEIGADNYVDVPYKADIYFEDTTFVGSIVGIKTGNIGRKFIGRGYIKVTNGEEVTYYYATQNDNARSLKSVATSYKGTDDYNSKTDEVKELVDSWASAADWSAQ